MAFERKHSAVADSTFSSTGATNWNANQTPSGADAGGIPYCPTATTETTSANLTYTETSGPRLQVGSGSTTSQGLILGYISSGVSGLVGTDGTLDVTNALLWTDGSNTVLNAGGADLYLRILNSTKATVFATAGKGLALTAGTATTDVNALSATQTWNAGGVAFTGWKFTITDTASAAGSLAMQILGGASGTTSLFKVTKGGKVDAPAYAANGTDGASFGPGLPTSITVVNGIVTAIS